MNYEGIRDALRVELAQASSLDGSFEEWIDLAVRDILKAEAFKYLCASSTITSVAGTRAYAKPSANGSIIAVWYKSTLVTDVQPTRELWRIQTRTDVRSMFDEEADGIPSHFFEDENDKIEFWPKPDAIYTFLVDHTAFPTRMTQDSDTNHLTQEWPMAIVYRAKWYGANSQGDLELAKAADSQWGDQMRRLIQFETQDSYAPMEHIPWGTDVFPRSGQRRER